MKNIQIVDGAENATFSLFQATDEEFAALFPDATDMHLIEDVVDRLGDARADEILNAVWKRPVLKREANGLHGTLFYEWEKRRHHLPASRREIDFSEHSINEAQRRLFRSKA